MSQGILDLRAPQAPLRTDDIAGLVRRLVQKNTRRWKLLAVLEGLAFAVSAVLAYLWIVFWLDNVLHLPVIGRLAASLGLVSCVIWLVVRLVGRLRKLRLSEDQVALAIERRTPGVQNRLINALQIARDAGPDHADLKQAVVAENVAQIQQLELEQAAALRPALLRVLLAGALIAVGGVFFLLQPDRFANAATRIFLPLVDVDPYYRTTLVVEPGDVEAHGDVPIRIRIRGERPAELVILHTTAGERGSEAVPVPAGKDVVDYTFKAVERSMTYAVAAGDFTTPFYRIDVPTPSHLSLVRATYHYPAYTRLAEKQTETAGGDLEALTGTRVELSLVFDQPAESVALVLERTSTMEEKTSETAPDADRITLRQSTPTEFAGELLLKNLSGYQIETRQARRAPHLSAPYSIRILVDQEPRLELAGLDNKSDVPVDATLPLRIAASDDFGLARLGLFYRRAADGKTPDTEKPENADENWTSLETWLADAKLEFRREFDLSLLALEAVEGRLEIVLRAQDSDPSRSDRWTSGTVYGVQVGGEGAALQLQYEQILRTEAEIKSVIAAQQVLGTEVGPWMRKLDADSGIKWDDAKNVTALHAAVAEQAKAQEQLRQSASRTARSMVEQAGNLRFSLGMLADTEMVRAVRILESVATRDEPPAKRAALADGQRTHERTLASLQEMLDQYVRFRQDWELAHMISFVKMLADRQAGLRDQSLRNAELKADPLAERRQASAARRQTKVKELSGLSKTAFAGLAERNEEVPEILAQAFATASQSLCASDLLAAIDEAVGAAQAGRWPDAAGQQSTAADALAAIHTALRKAQIEAARQALEALAERAKTDLEAQKALEKLKAGTDETFLKLPEKHSITDIIHMQELAAGKKKGAGDEESKVNDYLFADSQRSILQQPDSGKRQQFDILKLGTSLGKTPSFPAQSDREANSVTPHIQEEFEDLVGDLLEEADELNEKYESLNLNAAFNINEPGEIGKQAGDLNSTAAAAATGNKKQPTTNIGGASRSGRRGARAHGMVVGDESINRRGRDKAQEGQERVGDQEGTIKETMSDDPQRDTATGVGGKKVESDDTKFSVADAGKWTDDMAKRMGKPQNKNNIVERQGDRLDPRVAEMLRDLTSEHEQIIERVKTIKKELKNLYLPTDHVDEILAELAAQLDRLKERPSPEVFRLQQQTLDKLRGTLRVFHQAHSGFQPSVPREQAVRGRVLDESARQTLPGYEEAVKRYYEKLSTTVQP